MKILLSTEQVAAHARAAGTSSPSVGDDTRRVLGVLREAKHDPLTRKDVVAVLVGMGWDAHTIEKTHPYWGDIGEVLSSLRTVRKGYYSLFDTDLTTALTVPEAEPRAKRQARPLPSPDKPTITAAWFEAQMRDSALDRKVAALLKRKRPHEDMDDLLQEVRVWFLHWGRAGTCDSYIAEGKAPTVTILTCWMEGKLTQAGYKDGKDALTREMKGARTQGEIRVRRETGVTDHIRQDAACKDSDAPESVMVGDKEDGTRVREFVAPEPVEEMFDEDQISLVRDLVAVRHARAADRYSRYFDHLIQGRSSEEMAALEGDSDLRVSKITQRVREDLRDAPLLLQIAMRVLRVLSEEPFSEVDEVVKTFPRSEKTVERGDVATTLDWLVRRNLAFGKDNGEGSVSYCPTDEGHRVAEIGSFV